jgi:hypothetical protein
MSLAPSVYHISLVQRLQYSQFYSTYNLLIDATVLLGVLAHGATKLLLNGVEALVRVVLVAGGVLGGVGGRHDAYLDRVMRIRLSC